LTNIKLRRAPEAGEKAFEPGMIYEKVDSDSKKNVEGINRKSSSARILAYKRTEEV